MKKEMLNEGNRLQERHLNFEVIRRGFMQAMGMICAAAGILVSPLRGLTNSAWAAGKSIRFDGWGGIMEEAFRENAFKPFAAGTGNKVVEGAIGNMETYLSKVKASFPPGGEYNLVHLATVFDYARLLDLELGIVLDESKIPKLKNIMTAILDSYRAASNGTLSAIPYNYGFTGIAYNTKYVQKEKAEKMGAALLWDKAYKGKVGIWTDWRTNIWFAALYTGQNPNDIKDIDAIWVALRELRGQLKKYWGSGAELMSLLANEELYVTTAWSGRVVALQEGGHPIGLVAPKNSYAFEDAIFVFKGTDLELTYQLLDYLLEPKCAFAVSQGMKYPPTINPTKIDTPDYIKKLPGFDQTGKLDNLVFLDTKYWKKYQLEWIEKCDRIRAGA
jgi:spermidine/putrescine transport system substrate-binding protein